MACSNALYQEPYMFVHIFVIATSGLNILPNTADASLAHAHVNNVLVR